MTIDTREKDFLTATEIQRFLDAARGGRHGARDFVMAMMAYRHGLRVSELTGIRVDDVDLDGGRVFVRRAKGSMSTNHPMQGDEVRAVRVWLRERNGGATSWRQNDPGGTSNADSSPFLFLSQMGARFTRQAINYLFRGIGERAGLGHVHPHMLRHSCGYALANKGCDTRLIQDYLGHKDIHHTERYTRVSAARFERLWA